MAGACGRAPSSTIASAASVEDAFPEAPAAELESHGVQLSAPSGSDRAAVTQSQAEATAIGFRGKGTTIRKSLLIRFHYVPNAKFDGLCWAVSVVPPGDTAVPHRPAPAPGTTSSPDPRFSSTYDLIFVNADTGAIQITFEKGQAA
jgi:hypothetical protein